MRVPRGIIMHEDHVIEGMRRKGRDDILWNPLVDGCRTPEGQHETFVRGVASLVFVDIALGSPIESDARIGQGLRSIANARVLGHDDRSCLQPHLRRLEFVHVGESVVSHAQ